MRSLRLRSLDKAVACTQHMEMGTAALVQAKGQDAAQGPSNEHLRAPLGKQDQLKSSSAHKRDIFRVWTSQHKRSLHDHKRVPNRPAHAPEYKST